MSLVSRENGIYISGVKLTEGNCLEQILAHAPKPKAAESALKIFSELKLSGVKFVYKRGYLFDCIEELMEDHESLPVKKLNLNDSGFFYMHGDFSDIAEKELKSHDYVYVLNDLEIARVAFDNYMSFNGRGNSKFTERESAFIQSNFKGAKLSNHQNDQLVEFSKVAKKNKPTRKSTRKSTRKPTRKKN